MSGVLLFAGVCPPLTALSYKFSTVSSAVYGPGGVALDASGVIFVTAPSGQAVYKLSPAGVILAQYGSGTFTSAGLLDGAGTAARFSNPRGIALDTSGNIFVADSGNHAIRKITPAGAVTTVVGAAAAAGAIDGPATTARLNAPEGIAVDAAGNVFVADTGNHAIRRIAPSGVVTTFAGALGSAGDANGAGPVARFNAPQGLAIDAVGNLFVADTGNHVIRRITPAGIVSLVAGRAGSRGLIDDLGVLARFTAPQGVAVDAAGNVFV
ncbi:MAG: hypothetical protein JNL39_05465, partial [Opitutaceae bacterium]|nr:hypothetical protein [Opitutaceae bacterium]